MRKREIALLADGYVLRMVVMGEGEDKGTFHPEFKQFCLAEVLICICYLVYPGKS